MSKRIRLEWNGSGWVRVPAPPADALGAREPSARLVRATVLPTDLRRAWEK